MNVVPTSLLDTLGVAVPLLAVKQRAGVQAVLYHSRPRSGRCVTGAHPVGAHPISATVCFCAHRMLCWLGRGHSRLPVCVVPRRRKRHQPAPIVKCLQPRRRANLPRRVRGPLFYDRQLRLRLLPNSPHTCSSPPRPRSVKKFRSSCGPVLYIGRAAGQSCIQDWPAARPIWLGLHF